MTLLDELKGRIGERVAAVCGDPLLEQFLATVAEDYPDSARGKTLDLAQAEVCLRMATDASLWFKYTEGSESVDKTKNADQFLAVAKTLWAKHGVEGGGGTEGVIPINRDRITEEL